MNAKPNNKALNLAQIKPSRTTFRRLGDRRGPQQEQSNKEHVRDLKSQIWPVFADYEDRKSRWDKQNPEASPTERDAAIQAIALACGV
jgi:hypothetical protein